jgi:hypothetical protein
MVPKLTPKPKTRQPYDSKILLGTFFPCGALRKWCQYNRAYGTLPYPIQLQPELVTGAAGGLTGAEPYWPMYPTDTAAGVALLQLRIPRLRGM